MNAINETRRVLYVPMSDPDKEIMQLYCKTDDSGNILRQSTGQPIFKSYKLEQALIDEMSHVMYKCKAEFGKYCEAPYNQMIVPPAAFELMVEACEGGGNLVIHDFLSSKCMATGNPNDFLSRAEISRQYLAHVHGDNSSNQFNKFSFELADLKRFILTSFDGITEGRHSVDGTRIRGYFGIRLKQLTDRTSDGHKGVEFTKMGEL